MRISLGPSLAVVFASCGGTSPSPPRGSLEKATTVIAPDGAKCPDVVGSTRPVAIVTDTHGLRPIGRVTATRMHHDAGDACTWAEDGAASAARKLGGDLVSIVRRTPGDDDMGAKCTVEVRAFVRDGGEFVRDCARETVRGVDDSGIP
jgi:hypothetical protein